MEQDNAFMSSLMNYLFKKFDIKIKTVAPFNHQSLQPEHGIKSLSTILTKHVTDLGLMWPKYLPLAALHIIPSILQIYLNVALLSYVLVENQNYY